MRVPFVFIDNPNLKDAPLCINESDYDPKQHKIWSGATPEGTDDEYDRTAAYLKKDGGNSNRRAKKSTR